MKGCTSPRVPATMMTIDSGGIAGRSPATSPSGMAVLPDHDMEEAGCHTAAKHMGSDSSPFYLSSAECQVHEGTATHMSSP